MEIKAPEDPTKKWLTDAQMAELQKKVPGEELTQLRVLGHNFVARSPDSVIYREVTTMSLDENAGVRVDADSRMVFGCFVFPDTAELTRILNKHPGIITKLASELMKLAGARERIEVKK